LLKLLYYDIWRDKMFKNKLKEKLKNGKPAIGTFIMCNCPELVEIVGLSGYDFVVIDTEHGPLSIESTINLIRAAEIKGITPITRVTESSDSTILRSLDVGAHGIQVPQVNDATTAQRVAKASKYSPLGTRGAAMTRAGEYGTVNPMEYFTTENEETLVVVHCENKEGLNNLESIAKIPEIDVIFLGPFDMSQSLGVPGQIYHPLVEEAAEKVLKITKAAGKAAGIFVTDGEQAKKRIEQGFQYITINMDVTLFAMACKNEISKINMD
jgi:4-hydroxy-2-oxoheptanedioate aldolase